MSANVRILLVFSFAGICAEIRIFYAIPHDKGSQELVLFRRLPNHIVVFCTVPMVEKHINRRTPEEELKKRSQSNADDEWSHISGAVTKIEAADPLAVSDRTIMFGKERIPVTKEDSVKEKSGEFMDQINNTNQYIKFINAHLVEKKNKIEKIREAEKKFKEEVESLQNDTLKSRDELDRVNCKYITESDKKSLLVHLESELNSLKEKITYHTSQIERIQMEINEKNEKISYMAKDIHNAKSQVQYIQDPVKIIEAELAKLGINEDSRIRQAVEQLKNSK